MEVKKMKNLLLKKIKDQKKIILVMNVLQDGDIVDLKIQCKSRIFNTR